MAKRKQKKKDRKGIIILLLLLLGGAFLLFNNIIFQAQAEGFEIQVEYRTETGETGFLSLAQQRTLATVGGIAGITEIKLHPIVTNIGELDLQNVHVIGSSPQAFTDTIPPLSVDMAVGATQDFADPDPNLGWMDANALIGGDVIFEVTVEFSSFDAQGNTVVQDKTATLILNIVGDACDDGTPWGECSTILPQKCIDGVLTDSATDCGCPVGYEQVDESCVQSECDDGTIVGECTSQQPDYCDFDKTIIPNCGTCGCPDDFFGNPSTCDALTGTCVYDDYVADISITIESGSGEGPSGGEEPTGTAIFRHSTNAYIQPLSGAIAYGMAGCGNDLIAYGAAGSTTFTCGLSTATVLLTTPEGFTLCSRSGFDPSRFLYMDQVSRTILYNADDSDASKVEVSANSIDPTREIAC